MSFFTLLATTTVVQLYNVQNGIHVQEECSHFRRKRRFQWHRQQRHSPIACRDTLLQESVLDEQSAHDIWVDIGRRTAILKVSLSCQLDWERNTDRGSTIGNT
mmetsp:Transcript_8419/g.16855  ORF Transcript_8419/g.16855 Transcript_8419/m.16855 type:complete len:103 (+) Transcript_8419:552-860(+)